MAKAGTIESDDTIILGGQIDQTAGFEILDHAAVAVQQDQRHARATFDIVEPDAVYFQELTSGRVVAFSILGQAAVHQGRYRQSSDDRSCSHDIRMRLSNRAPLLGKRFLASVS